MHLIILCPNLQELNPYSLKAFEELLATLVQLAAEKGPAAASAVYFFAGTGGAAGDFFTGAAGTGIPSR